MLGNSLKQVRSRSKKFPVKKFLMGLVATETRRISKLKVNLPILLLAITHWYVFCA